MSLLAGLIAGSLPNLDDAATDLMEQAPQHYPRVLAEHADRSRG